MSNLGAWADPALVLIICVVTLVLTAVILRYAKPLGLVQTANARSSHSGQKPTGGGIAIAGAGLLAGFWLNAGQNFPLFGLGVIAFSLALVGFQDDRRNLSVRVRLLAQFLALGIALVITPSFLSVLEPLPGWLAWILFVGTGLVWINFYNFMDGIDGMAASEAVFLGSSVLVLVVMGSGRLHDPAWVFAVCIVCATLIFLLFNWAPSRLFMGDGGAYYLSFILLAIALFGAVSGHYPLASALILPALFVSDAGVTLLRRLSRDRNWFEAHRTHAYQQLSRRLGHARTVLLYMAINCFWLLVWALIVQAGLVNPWLSLIIAYLPVLAFVMWAQAGRPENAG